MSTRVAIIGAGPYGLSLAAHLTAQGIEHRIFGHVMESWDRHMPTGMFLKSEGFASNINEPAGRWTLRNFCEEAELPYADIGWPIPLETFSAYGRWFQQHLVPHVEEDEVSEVRRADGGFAVELVSGAQVLAERVVVATGLTGFAYVPPELRSLPPDRLSHTYDHADFTGFEGRRVAVLGAGQSALETAALLRESGAQPELIVRSARMSWNPNPYIPGLGSSRRFRLRPTPLGGGSELWSYWHFMQAFPLFSEERRVRFVRRVLGPAGAWWLRGRIVKKVPANLGQELVSAESEDGGVVLRLRAAGGHRELRVDHVIAGTGYHVDVDRLEFLSPDLRRRLARLRTVRGAPALSAGFESSIDGFYLVGLVAAHTFGPAMRFVCGSSFAGPRVAHRLGGRVKTPRS